MLSISTFRRATIPMLIVTSVVGSNAFALFDQSYRVKLSVSAPGEIVDLASQTKTQIQAENQIDMQLTEPKIVQLDGRIPMMLIPMKDGATDLKLDPPKIKEATSHLVQGDISNNVSEIIQGIEDVRSQIRGKNYDDAMTRLQALQTKYPKVAFLEFVKASILFLQGNKSAARSAASIGLKAHPDFEDGRKFLQSLGKEAGQ